MTYETDLKELYQKFDNYWKNNKDNIDPETLKQWLKYAYISGAKIK